VLIYSGINFDISREILDATLDAIKVGPPVFDRP
jgi:hypothetical protein